MVSVHTVLRSMLTRIGFDRNTAYAEYINEQLQATQGVNPHIILPPGFHRHITVVAAAIYEHLAPIISLGQETEYPTEDIGQGIYDIVATAGILSLQMRADPHTVYYFVPTFKEDTYTSKTMECFNHRNMVDTNPRNKTTWPQGTTEAEKARARNDDGLTQIVLMDGITAYRQGGWETPDSTPFTPKYAEPKGKETGVRCRVITNSWVYCRWGRARKFKDGKPADDKTAHGATWKDPGFVEFRDVLKEYKEEREKGAPGRKGKGKAVSPIATRRDTESLR